MAIKVIGVTGSRGFLGREIVAELELVSNTKIRKIVRSPSTGDEGAISGRSIAEKRMTPAQIAEGQQLSTEIFERIQGNQEQ
mgnify:CR=1 FL=1